MIAAPRARPNASRHARSFVASLAVVATFLAGTGPAWGQRRITIEPERFAENEASGRARISIDSEATERERLREMLADWRTYIQERNFAEAQDVLGPMKEILQAPGVKDEQTLLAGFVALGRDWALTENWEFAQKAYQAALDLNPRYAPAHLALAQISRDHEGGIRGLAGMLAGIVRATKLRLLDPLGELRLVANLAFVILVAAAACVAGFALVLLVKYNRLLRHGAQEALANRVPEGIDRVLAWALVFLPVLLWLAPPWWVLYWLVLLSGYGTKAERRLAIVALVVAALLPGAFYGVTAVASLHDDPVIVAAEQLQRRDVMASTIADVERVVDELNKTPTKTPEGEFLLGRLYSEAARYDDAVAAYNEVVAIDPSRLLAVVNRGTIQFRRGDVAQAIADYKLATDRDESLAVAWRNGSIAQAQNLQANEASKWLANAQKIDRGAVEEWSATVGPDHAVDADPSFRDISRLVLAEHPDLVAGIGPAFVNQVTIAAVVGLLIVVVRSRRGMRALEAAACEKCGRAFCSRCHATARNSAYCTQCIHLYVKKDGVSPVVRTAKLREVEKWVAINNIAIRFFNLVLPGAGSLYGNRLLVGTVILGLWAAALASLLLQPHLLTDPERLGNVDLVVLFGAELALLVLVYLVALIQSLRHSG